MRGRDRALLLLAVVMACCPGAAAYAAASPDGAVARLPDGAGLTVADKTSGGQPTLAVTLRPAPTTPDEQPAEHEDADAPPAWPDEVIHIESEDERGTRLTVGGAVVAAAAAIEIRLSTGEHLRIPTVPGESYTGRSAGRVRFYLGEIPLAAGGGATVETVKLLDAGGVVIGVPESPTAARTTTLTRRRVAGHLVRFGATLARRSDPVPGEPERRSSNVCLTVRVSRPAFERASICSRADAPPRLGGIRGCGTLPTLLTGFVPAKADHLTIVLGSGRTTRVTARPAPFGRSDRVVLAAMPGGEAVRRALLVDGSGRILARQELGVAPPDRRCPPPLRSYLLDNDWGGVPAVADPRPTAVQEAASLGPGGPRLVVADDGDRICMGIGDLGRGDLGCSEPPLNGRFGLLELLPTASGPVLVGTYPAPIAAVQVTFDDRTTARLPAVPATGYTGRYRDHLRFVLATAPAGRLPVAARLLDATGADIGGAFLGGPAYDDTPVGTQRVTASAGRGAGAAQLVVGGVRTPPHTTVTACIGVVLAGEQRQCGDDVDINPDRSTANAIVSCTSRTTTLFGIARHTVRRVEIALASGRRIVPRLHAFPRTAGSSARAYLVVVGARDSVVRVRFAGQRATRRDQDTLAMPTPRPVRQCGYRVDRTLTAGRD